MPTLHLEVSVAPRVHLALHQVGAPFLPRAVLHNRGEDDAHDVVVQITADPAFAEPLTLTVDRVPAAGAASLDTRQLVLSAAFLAHARERAVGHITIAVRVGGVEVARHVSPVEVLAPSEWPGISVLPELLAAFVRPNARVIPTVTGSASRRLTATGQDGSLEGYQRRDPRRAAAIAQAVWEAVAGLGVRYIGMPASFEKSGQKIRTHEEVVAETFGNCLDLSVLIAAAWEAAGLHAFLVVVDGHAFPGVWLTDFHLHEPTLDDPLPIRKRIELGEALVVDSSAAAQGATFADAVRVAEAAMRNVASFVLAIDVAAARFARVLPLPLELDANAMAGAALRPPTPASQPAGVAAAGPLGEALPADRFRPATPQAEGTTRTRLDRWKAKLLDLSLRNRLLNHRDGAKVLAFPHLDLAAFEDALAAGETFEILPASPPRVDDPRATPPDPAAIAAADLAQRRLRTASAPKELEERALQLFRTARSAEEESGAVLLYAGLGELVWYESDASTQPRRAPLVLVPVRLDRTRAGAGAGWRLRRAEDETRVNVTLLKKLEIDFGMAVEGLDVLVEDGSGVDVGKVLHDLRRLVRDRSRWEVVEHATVALFSFQKFLMWLDLEARTDDLLGSPVVRHLFDGGGQAFGLAAPVVADQDVEVAKPVQRLVTVVDADPTQLAAIHAATDGSSFVLQGPPGTGKSQTITNLVAQLLAENKSVLFVSEKRAALDVVHRRLSAVGLGPFTLELHAQQANKTEVFRQLREAFEVAPSDGDARWQAHAEALGSARATLAAHVARLSAPAPFGGTVRDAMAGLFALEAAPRVELPEVDPRTLSGASVAALRAAAAQTVRAEDEVDGLAGHPWRGVRAHPWTPELQRGAEGLAQGLAAAAARVHATLASLRHDLALPGGLSDAAVVEAARLAASAPGLPRAALGPALRADLPALRALVDRLQGWRRERDALLTDFDAGIVTLPLEDLIGRFRAWQGRFFLFALFALWGARRAVRALLRGGSASDGALLDGLQRARAVRDGEASLRADTLGPRLGGLWRGPDSSPEAVSAALDHAEALRRFQLAYVDDAALAAQLEPFLLLCTDGVDRIAPDAPAGARLRDALAAIDALRDAQAAARDHLRLDEASAFGPHPAPSRLGEVAQAWLAALPRLRAMCGLAAVVDHGRSLGLGPALDAVLAGTIPADALPDTVERALRLAWWEARLTDDPALATFRGRAHEDVIRSFQQLDRQALTLAREAVVARLASRAPNVHAPGDEMAKLRKQLTLQRGQWSVRRLFREAPGVLSRLKPCVLMSPLSVAQVLAANHRFDVVIFDEASQIPPWDAVGAIGRGNQVVVVGDSKQMPPTSFFARGEESDDAAFFDEEDVSDTESILDEAVASGLPQLRLRWHYRSKHESLIAFSNHHYYENSLLTFPSAALQGSGVGVEYVAVQGFYDRGKARHNEAEAQAIVQELVRLLDLPDDQRPTVGVVTFSMPQQTLVQDLVDKLLAQRPELARHFGDAVDEPVFIKNLENVQGDERDVMLFSICYGPDAAGKVTMNFGPLNRKGGERRLNVAVTRARKRLVVFSTLDWSQILDHTTAAIGVAHLKNFLRYAKEGPSTLLALTHAPGQPDFGSPFEAEVYEVLTAAGHMVHSQVGCSGYRIDLAVVDPERPGAYLIAIEADGATYHGSRVARARDRLRQDVLESLGWRFHRIWSTDWWHDRRGETERLLAAVETARHAPRKTVGVAQAAAAAAPPTAPPAAAAPSFAEQLATGPVRTTPPAGSTPWVPLPERQPGGDRAAFDDPRATRKVAATYLDVVARHGPMLQESADRATANAFGLALGARIRARIQEAVGSLPPEQRPPVREGFVWPVGTNPTTWPGFRAADEGAGRDIADVPAQEAANAAHSVLVEAIRCSREVLVRETAARLGVSARAKGAKDRLEAGIDALVQDGRARVEGDKVQVGSGASEKPSGMA
jgi:very-short-patch-repair endonuclease